MTTADRYDDRYDFGTVPLLLQCESVAARRLCLSLFFICLFIIFDHRKNQLEGHLAM